MLHSVAVCTRTHVFLLGRTWPTTGAAAEQLPASDAVLAPVTASDSSRPTGASLALPRAPGIEALAFLQHGPYLVAQPHGKFNGV